MVAKNTAMETIAEAAGRLGVHPRTIRRRIADGTLTGYRVGTQLIRLDPAEVDALLRPIPTVFGHGGVSGKKTADMEAA